MGRTELDVWSHDAKRQLLPAFAAVWAHLVVEDPVPRPADRHDAIFCFGSRHWRVPERAAALFHAGAAPLVVVTGGPAAPGEPTEADRFARALVARGVPSSAIVEEHEAIHTGENVRLGLEALRRRSPSGRLLLVSWPLAARRCRATFGVAAPEVEVASAPALRRPGWRWVPAPRRARDALGELARLDRYGALGIIEPHPTPASVRAAADVLAAALSADGAAGVEVEAARAVVEAEDAALLG